jgi:cyclase
MCNGGHSTSHQHSHNHVTHSHLRRDFLRLMGSTLAGASILELAYHRAAWARAAELTFSETLFTIEKVTSGVYFAHAHPQAMINCNAAIFVRSKDVVVVDAHSKPSAAAALIQQISRQVTCKPVRYVINTHFHWDHTQGNQAYRAIGGRVDFIASAATKQLMSELSVTRLKESIDGVPAQIEKLRDRASRSTDPAEKAFCDEQIRQMQAYVAELSDFHMEPPTITFEKAYVLRDPAFDLHIEFHGHSHTAGDIFVFCPQRRAIATGDAIHGFLPFIADGFPRVWPATIDTVAQADFRFQMGGHGPFQTDRTVMTCLRNYIEELTGRVAEARQAGLSLDEMQKRITVASLRSLQSNGYQDFLVRTRDASEPHYGPGAPLQDGVNVNIRDVLANLDRG